MAATVDWYLPRYDPDMKIVGGSGLGFFASSFAGTVAVEAYQDTTYCTNGAGTIQSNQADNNKYISTSGVSINGADRLLTQLPNQNSTVEIRFSNDTPVQLQNWKLYAYDRVNQNNAPSGVVLKVASISHLSNSQTDNNGSGSSLWATPAGVTSHTLLPPSPGFSGVCTNGVGTTSTVHSFYLAMSASPSSVGSKVDFGLLAVGEYL